MSLREEENTEVVPVSKTEFVPKDSTDRPSVWRRFWKPLLEAIGIRSLYFSEGWVTAKVRQENAKAEVDESKAAKNRFEGEARLLEAQTKFEASKALAETQRVLANLACTQKNAEESLEDVLRVISQIQQLGGCVEFRVSEEDVNE